MAQTAFSAIALVAVALTVPAGWVQPQPDSSPLWGQLVAGTSVPGYTTRFVTDRSRTWASPSPARPDDRGRPIRISMWYPALGGRAPMRIADYVRPGASAAFADVEAALEHRDGTVTAEWAPPDQLPTLMATRMRAVRDATPVSGRFPLVLYAAGINAYTLSNVVLAEFLATQGMIVVTVPSLGPSSDQPEQQYDALELGDALRDLEFAWSVVRDDPRVDPTKLAVVGHSLGGTIALLVAMHHANVVAAVGLDGTYGFAGSDADAFTAQYAPSRFDVRAAILDVRRMDATADLRAVRAFHHADRYFVSIPDMFHGSFTSFQMGAQVFHLAPAPNARPGWTQATGASGYQQVCVGVLAFLRAAFGENAEPFQCWQAAVTTAGASVMHDPAASR
jgi:dienelactone hydrolase